MSGNATALKTQSRTSSPGAHTEAWEAISQAHAAVTGRLQEALTNAGLPPLAWYEVLVAIADAPEGRIKMGELAEALVISRGGLTKLIDRLVNAGLLERVFCETDRRVSYASLLPAGTELLAEMRPIVEFELELTFTSIVTERQAREISSTLGKVRGNACGNT
jgi:DNA-binding MarR family transcriptional regulator